MISITTEMPQELKNGDFNRMFLDLNSNVYQCIAHPSPNQPKDDSIGTEPLITLTRGNDALQVVTWIGHNYEDQFDVAEKYLTNHPSRVLISNFIPPKCTVLERLVTNDFLFNRTKAYYSQFPFAPYTNKWYHHGNLGYMIPEVKPSADKGMIYVAPCKSYCKSYIDVPNVTSRKYRTKIIELLGDFTDRGYIGTWHDDKETFLYTHREFPWDNDIETIMSKTEQPHYDDYGYSPPHNEYYRDSFISIYGETVEYGRTVVITEKTYDPLIKGHFVLPFSTSGTIKHLKSIGFKLPDFIDYSYDDIVDDDERYNMYGDEVKRLLNMSMDTWRTLWDENYDIIRHNQLHFHETPYDRVDLEQLFEKFHKGQR